MAERRHGPAGPPPGCSRPSASSGRIIGYRDLAKLSVAIEHELNRHRQPTGAHTPTEEAAIVATAA